jgi:hypothetical protein
MLLASPGSFVRLRRRAFRSTSLMPSKRTRLTLTEPCEAGKWLFATRSRSFGTDARVSRLNGSRLP